MLPVIAIILLAGGGTVAIHKHRMKARNGLPAQGHAVDGMPTQGADAPVGLTAPGVPQPSGSLVALKPIDDPSKALHDSAADLLVNFQKMGQRPDVAVDEVKAFQQSFNDSKPLTELLVDGFYSSKTQAALQSVISPAIAPDAVNGTALVVIPSKPAELPHPIDSDNIDMAATGLQMYFQKNGVSQGSIPEVVTFQTAWNDHHNNQPVIPDGIYGASTELALQSYLTYRKDPMTAPKNAYGPPDKAIVAEIFEL